MPELSNDLPLDWSTCWDEVPRAHLEQIRAGIDDWGEREAPTMVAQCRQAAPSTPTSVSAAPPT